MTEFLDTATERHRTIIARMDGAEGQSAAQLQEIRNDLENLLREVAKLRKQQLRDAIVLESIVAGMPVSGDSNASQG